MEVAKNQSTTSISSSNPTRRVLGLDSCVEVLASTETLIPTLKLYWLQIDFKTKLLCSIQKGIVKRQLPFALVKSCDDGAGSRFSISFKGHHDYELEATSLEDKHKVNLHRACVCMRR